MDEGWEGKERRGKGLGETMNKRVSPWLKTNDPIYRTP